MIDHAPLVPSDTEYPFSEKRFRLSATVYGALGSIHDFLRLERAC